MSETTGKKKTSGKKIALIAGGAVLAFIIILIIVISILFKNFTGNTGVPVNVMTPVIKDLNSSIVTSGTVSLMESKRLSSMAFVCMC